ncbi:hypothetical protein BGX21_006836 [Mortierella sp. AD011]|nr:hypothetical protein BGX21_006836 [Mortierella sp. AD011]
MVKLHSIAPYFGEVIETHDNTLDCEVVRASGRDAGEYMQEWAGGRVPMSKNTNVKIEELNFELRDLQNNSSTSASIASTYTESPPHPTSDMSTNPSSGSFNTVDENLSKLDMVFPQLSVVKLYNEWYVSW